MVVEREAAVRVALGRWRKTAAGCAARAAVAARAVSAFALGQRYRTLRLRCGWRSLHARLVLLNLTRLAAAFADTQERGCARLRACWPSTCRRDWAA